MIISTKSTEIFSMVLTNARQRTGTVENTASPYASNMSRPIRTQQQLETHEQRAIELF